MPTVSRHQFDATILNVTASAHTTMNYLTIFTFLCNPVHKCDILSLLVCYEFVCSRSKSVETVVNLIYVPVVSAMPQLADMSPGSAAITQRIGYQRKCVL